MANAIRDPRLKDGTIHNLLWYAIIELRLTKKRINVGIETDVPTALEKIEGCLSEIQEKIGK